MDPDGLATDSDGLLDPIPYEQEESHAARLLEGRENAWGRFNGVQERRRALEAEIEANDPANQEWVQVPAGGRIAEDGKPFDRHGHPYPQAA